MFSPWSYPIFALAIIAAWSAWELPRARLWIFGAMISFVFTSLWFRHVDQVSHPLLTFACDAVLSVVVIAGARERYEIAVCAVFITSCIGGYLRLWGAMDAGSYAIWLEICNYLALFMFTGVGLLQRTARLKSRAPAFVHWCLSGARHSL